MNYEKKVALIGQLKAVLSELEQLYSSACDSEHTHIESIDYHIDKLLELTR